MLPEAIDNTRRLQAKMDLHLPDFTFFDLDEQEGATTLVVSYGITAQASREAVKHLRGQDKKVSLLVTKTLLPTPDTYVDVCDRYERVIVAEENLKGRLRTLLYGTRGRKGLSGVNGIAKMISPMEIVEEVQR